MVANSFSRLVRFASLAICLIALASFVGFAVEQSKGASDHQQAELAESAPAWQRAASEQAANEGTKTDTGKSALRKAIDGAFAKLSSPFSAVTNSISSPWTLHIVNMLLALLLYGFGLGLVARVVRFGD